MSPHNRSRYIAMLAIVLTTFFFTDIEAQASDTIWLKPYFKSVQQSSLGIQCVGWSRTGICAILQTLEAGERGGYYLRFLLLDSVDDATIFDKQAHTDDLGPNTFRARAHRHVPWPCLSWCACRPSSSARTASSAKSLSRRTLASMPWSTKGFPVPTTTGADRPARRLVN